MYLVTWFLYITCIVTFFNMVMQPSLIDNKISNTKQDRAYGFISSLLWASGFFIIYHFNLYVCTYQEWFDGLMLGMCGIHILSGLCRVFYTRESITKTFNEAIFAGLIDVIILLVLAICMTA